MLNRSLDIKIHSPCILFFDQLFVHKYHQIVKKIGSRSGSKFYQQVTQVMTSRDIINRRSYICVHVLLNL